MSLIRGFPWNCETKWAQETRIMDYLADKSLLIPAAVWIQCVTDGDGQTQRDAASRGKKKCVQL